MRAVSYRKFVAAAALAITTFAAQPVAAQDPQLNNVVSANPFGILLEFFNAEYERVITESSTVGVGGSFFSADSADYGNADVFWRYYPGPKPLEGWAFGAKVGLTKIEDSGPYFGYGFDVNHSWLMGKNDNFYVGIGFGLKRLVGVTDDVDDEDFVSDDVWKYVPTFRIINVGFAF